jgi:ribosomal protein S17E
MGMQNFSSLACTQTDLDKFLTIFEENFMIFQENSLANSEKFQTWVCNFLLNLAKHVYAKCQLSILYPDGLRHIFEENFRIFQENSLANSKKIQTWVCTFILNLAKHVHAKFQLSSLNPDGLRHIFDNFWRKFQDFSGKLLSKF